MKRLLIIIICLFLTGCYNYVEINDLELVNGIFLDYKSDKYIGSFDIDEIKSSEGTTISDLFRNFEELIDKKAYYAHIKTIIISKEILNNHFDELIDFILRNNEIRNNFYLIVSDNVLDNYKSSKIKNLITNKKYNNHIIKTCLFKNIVTTYLKNNTILLPTVSKVNEDIEITGSTAKNKNTTLEFNIDETRLLGIVLNKHPNILYKNINIYNSKTKYKNNKIYINLEGEVKELKKENISKSIKKDIISLINKTKENNINVLNMKNKYFKDSNTKVKVKVNINRNGQLLYEIKK